ncbi:hypothetical protein NA78x_002270 [Anatilimnocola sp. NA78]|uniref:hypothetical protein n=1 Tax=Anatilimnocola sp. NA78 TaxID=3415683 RepID=UPI003CE553C1
MEQNPYESPKEKGDRKPSLRISAAAVGLLVALLVFGLFALWIALFAICSMI